MLCAVALHLLALSHSHTLTHNTHEYCTHSHLHPTLTVLFPAGALPDQIEFSRDCDTILVSNEGEPLSYTSPSLATDPEGSVSIIKLQYCYGIRTSSTAPVQASGAAQADAAAVQPEAASVAATLGVDDVAATAQEVAPASG